MVEQLAGAVARSLVTVVGPQCAGMIGLLATWVRTHCDRQPVDWLVIHADRDDPATFWRSVLAALNLTGVTLPDIEPPVPGERLPAAFIIRLAARLGEQSRPVVLVVDDAEHLTRRETV
jgi:LuxR family transcriptional regulator, maltose regulon positive regulatory protein